MELIKVKAARDESGHWYIIPNEMYDEFAQDNWDEIPEFDSKWGKYMSGGVNDIQLYAKI